MTPRVWRRSEPTAERVVLGVRSRSPAEKPTLVPAQVDARIERIEALEKQNESLQQSLQALKSELQDARRDAEQRGFEAGMQDAGRKIDRELEQRAAAFKTATDEMLRANDQKQQALRTEIADLVLAGVIKILGEQLLNANFVRASAEQLLKESGATTAPMRVLLSPQQHEQLTRSAGAPLAWFRDRRLEIGADERVQYGGCILETPQGIVDGRFEVQLEKLHQVLRSHSGASR